MDTSSKDPKRPERIAAAADEVAKVFDEKQKGHIAEAQQYGYAKEVMKTLSNNFRGQPDNPLFTHAEDMVNKFRIFVDAKESASRKPDYNVSSQAWLLGTSVAANVSVSIDTLNVGMFQVTMPQPPPDWPVDRVERYAARLDEINPGLGDTFRSTRTHILGATEDAERTALFGMRQTYDVLMRHLAPDNDVRQSVFFAKKDGDKPNAIHRIERIRFAANIRVHDPEQRALLESEASNMVELYQRLNALHADSRIDKTQARNLVVAMRAVIEQWLDATQQVA